MERWLEHIGLWIEIQWLSLFKIKNTHGFDVGTDGHILWIKVKDLRPNELGEMYSVRILSDDGSVIVETSPSVYIKKALLSENVKLDNLCKAMWAYGQSAREYL